MSLPPHARPPRCHRLHQSATRWSPSLQGRSGLGPSHGFRRAPSCRVSKAPGLVWRARGDGSGCGGGALAGDPPLTARAPPALRLAVLAYMQLLEDYSEPQPSVFYQTPQNEHIYQQKNKLLMEVYGFNDSFSAEAPQELAPPPALPPKQRQLVSRALLPARPPCVPRRLPRGALTSSWPAHGPAPRPPRPGGGGALASIAAPAAGPGLCSECLLSLPTVSCFFLSSLAPL